MIKFVNSVLDNVLNLKVFTGKRTIIVGAMIIALHVWKGFAGAGVVPHIDDIVFYPLIGVLAERIANFAKEHKT